MRLFIFLFFISSQILASPCSIRFRSEFKDLKNNGKLEDLRRSLQNSLDSQGSQNNFESISEDFLKVQNGLSRSDLAGHLRLINEITPIGHQGRDFLDGLFQALHTASIVEISERLLIKKAILFVSRYQAQTPEHVKIVLDILEKMSIEFPADSGLGKVFSAYFMNLQTLSPAEMIRLEKIQKRLGFRNQNILSYASQRLLGTSPSEKDYLSFREISQTFLRDFGMQSSGVTFAPLAGRLSTGDETIIPILIDELNNLNKLAEDPAVPYRIASQLSLYHPWKNYFGLVEGIKIDLRQRRRFLLIALSQLPLKNESLTEYMSMIERIAFLNPEELQSEAIRCLLRLPAAGTQPFLETYQGYIKRIIPEEDYNWIVATRLTPIHKTK